MPDKPFVVSADGHILEPTDLFVTRLPVHLRDRGVWEEDFEIEPLVEGGARVFRRLHTPGFEGWTISRYRQTGGRMPEGDPKLIIEDLESDGVDVGVMHPNLSLFGLYSDDHELSMAHARVYNDYIIERFSPYFSRLAPTAPVPITDVDDAVAEIERVAAAGFRAILLPATPPMPYYSRDFDPIWAAAQSNGVHAFFHTQTGGVKLNDPASTTLKVVMENAAQVNRPMTEKSASKRMITQAIYSTIVPQQLLCELIGGGVAERYPDLHFSLIEFNAHWLASLVGAMDKCWVTGTGQDADWWLGVWDETRAPTEQVNMAQLFRLNEKWPYPLAPSEYVRRQFHVSFQDDPVAVACRHLTGVSSIVWGNDYPHAEGTFRGSRQLLAEQFAGVPDDERDAMVGGTLGGLLVEAGGEMAPERAMKIIPRESPLGYTVMTNVGCRHTSALVVAAGAWSGRLLDPLGVRLPLEAERGYHAMLPSPGIEVKTAITNKSRGFALTPMEGGLRIAGTVEFAGLDAPPNERRAEVLLEHARRMFAKVDVTGHSLWMGFRPSTPDSLPIVGAAPGRPGLYLAFGHGHFGMTGGPPSGRLLSRLITGREPDIDAAPYAPVRFL